MIRPISFGGNERLEIIKERKTNRRTDISRLKKLLALQPTDVKEAHPEIGSGNGIRIILEKFAGRIESSPKSVETVGRIGNLQQGEVRRASWDLTYEHKPGKSAINDLIEQVNAHLRGIGAELAKRGKQV